MYLILFALKFQPKLLLLLSKARLFGLPATMLLFRLLDLPLLFRLQFFEPLLFRKCSLTAKFRLMLLLTALLLSQADCLRIRSLPVSCLGLTPHLQDTLLFARLSLHALSFNFQARVALVFQSLMLRSKLGAPLMICALPLLLFPNSRLLKSQPFGLGGLLFRPTLGEHLLLSLTTLLVLDWDRLALGNSHHRHNRLCSPQSAGSDVHRVRTTSRRQSLADRERLYAYLKICRPGELLAGRCNFDLITGKL